ncbi:hypothetical protein [Amycolatopsis sp. cmx-4-54]|uniref:hypothetical protein n=1 Tax=Amycolatopsis sp. cmx-4-54 TaxID=2790936 RepID=UPI00397897EA
MTAPTDTDLPAVQLCILGCRNLAGKPFRAQHGYLTCDPCADTLRADLRELARSYPSLSAAPSGGGASTGRGTPGFGSRSPARDSVIALTDRRTHSAEDGDPHSVLEVLSSWADNVREEVGLARPDEIDQRQGQLLVGWLDFTARQPWAGRLDTPLDQLRAEITSQLGLKARTVGDEAAFLATWFAHMTRQYWVADFAAEVRELLSSVRTAIGAGERRIPVGTCPTPVGVDARPCGARLRVRADEDWISCPKCRTRWPRTNWDELSGAQGVPVSDVAMLSEWLRVPAGTLRRWRSEDGWPNHGTKRRPLYERNAVLASWQRRRGGLQAG